MLDPMPRVPLKMKPINVAPLDELLKPLSAKIMPKSALRGDDGHELTVEEATERQRASTAARINVAQREDRRKPT